MSGVQPISLQQVAAGSDQAQRVKQIQSQQAQQEAAQQLAGIAQREAAAKAERVAGTEKTFHAGDRVREQGREESSRRRRRRPASRRGSDPGAGSSLDVTA
ncbi:hypothetical protein Gocc_0421 [Gaiella occulta]|uniref:Uncharacterized protein n=1 Tax=Gaiella occulta TaxID=1002870 RepID=A0A7M2Z288_9ACTN|nr:hypothetical protein [Gaiella occulta]RDI76002.1 hypothetical protein Gocc_0421 [Gaiella occulta]